MQTSKQVQLTTKLVVNAKKQYNPSPSTAQNNAQSWATVQGALAKGPQTRQQLQTLLQTQHNHAPFIGYAIRRGWLVPAKAGK